MIDIIVSDLLLEKVKQYKRQTTKEGFSLKARTVSVHVSQSDLLKLNVHDISITP